MEENNLYIVYMPRIAAALREMGFKLIKVTPNNRKPQYDVYWFEDTPALRSAFPEAVRRAQR